MQEHSDSRSNTGRARGLVLLLCLLVLLSHVQPIATADFWHHVAAGRYAWEHGPAATEPFAHTARGYAWVQFEWLSQVLLFLGYVHLGATALILGKALLFTAACLLLARACNLRAGMGAATALTVMAASCAFISRSFVRPEMFSLPLLGACVWILEEWLHGRRRALWLLVPVFAIWPNFHGLYAAGIALVGIVVGGRTLTYWLYRRTGYAWFDDAAEVGGTSRPASLDDPAGVSGRGSRRPAHRPHSLATAWLVFLACLAATLCNPYGWRIWEVPFRLFGSPLVREVIAEWKAPTFGMVVEAKYLPVAALTLLALALGRRLRLTDLLRLAAFGFLAVRGVRHVSLFAFVCAPVLVVPLDAAITWMSRRLNRPASVPSDSAAAQEHPQTSLRVAPGFFQHGVAAALMLTMAWAALGWPRFSALGFGFDERQYPVKAAAFLRDERVAGRLFNTYHYGNYFLWALDPEVNPVFIDGRIDMYGVEVLAAYKQIDGTEPGWREALARYGVDIAVLRRREGDTPTPLADALMADRDWRLIFWDDQALIFLRDTPAQRATLARLGAFTIRPESFDAAKLLNRAAWDAAVGEAERTLARDPLCLLAHDMLGACDAMVGDNQQAAAQYEAVLGGDPESGTAAYSLATSWMALKAYDRAELLLRYAAERQGPQPQTQRMLGNLYFETGRFAEAVRQFHEAIGMKPNDWPSYWNLAQACQRVGDHAGYVQALRDVVRLKPDHAEARRLLTEAGGAK